ncbi:MAG: SDR family oxidoreductase [Gammaproteobacteria bacterium]|nr:SDR family oxidoreductase [Gammaproteobacteria bacterium]
MSGKVALITGSSRGIGRAIAVALAGAGARVVISSRKADACEAVAASISASGGEAIAIPCNVSRADELRALVNRTLSHWKTIDVLVCNAAVNPHFGSLQDIPDDAYDKIMTTNVKNTLWLCRMVIPGMAERGGGAVIIVSSIAGLKGTRSLGTYALSKAADMQLARNLAVEWGRSNVRVNCIAPGLVRTDFARALWENPETRDKALGGYPLGRLGEPEDVAGAALYLASKAGSWVTGQTLVVDGGAMISGGQYS